MEINHPDVVAEVMDVHARYEQALIDNDVATLTLLFWDSPKTLRFGPNGTLIGHAAISAFRQTRTSGAGQRQVEKLIVTTFGRDFAATNQEARRPGSDRVTRQSQTWVRMREGWRIVSAHVSDI
jgi:Protein of unknown function (DUF3225)